MRTVWGRPRSIWEDDEREIYEELLGLISEEILKLSKVIEGSLDKEEYRSHYDWLLSCNNLITEKRDLEHIILEQNKIKNKVNNLPQYRSNK